MILVKRTLNRMTSLEGIKIEHVNLFILFLATETDHRMPRKRKLLSFSDL